MSVLRICIGQSGNCNFTNIDLSPLTNYQIQCVFTDEWGSYNILYQPCTNTFNCFWNDPTIYMAVQQSYFSGTCIAGLAQYDPNVIPIQYDNAFNLTYRNGEGIK